MTTKHPTLPDAIIVGVGAVTALGRGWAAQVEGLAAAPPTSNTRSIKDGLLHDASNSRAMRRADRFSKMAVAACVDACDMTRSSSMSEDSSIGLIVATGFGPHVRTFRFLDGILDHGDAFALPTDFSHSVHNAAAGYITQQLGITGRTCTITRFQRGFIDAVRLAQCWLAENVCDRVFVGAVDELGEVALSLVDRMCGQHITPGEGAVFFELAPTLSLCNGMGVLNTTDTVDDGDLFIMDEGPVMPAAGTRQAGSTPLLTLSPWFGHLACSEAFGMLGALAYLIDNKVRQQLTFSFSTYQTSANIQYTTDPIRRIVIDAPNQQHRYPALILTQR